MNKLFGDEKFNSHNWKPFSRKFCYSDITFLSKRFLSINKKAFQENKLKSYDFSLQEKQPNDCKFNKKFCGWILEIRISLYFISCQPMHLGTMSTFKLIKVYNLTTCSESITQFITYFVSVRKKQRPIEQKRNKGESNLEVAFYFPL